MEGVDSISQSVWQDTQIMPENSVRLAENVEGFQQCVQEILNLIKQDENISETTPEIHDSKKSKLTTLVTNLSRIHESLADQHVHLIEEVSSAVKNQQLDPTSPQVTQMFTPDQKSAHKFMTPIGFDALLSSGGGNGGSYNPRTEASDSSFSLSSDSESESSISVNKLLISPLNDDSSKAKEPKLQDPSDVLLKKISVLEQELLSLSTNLQKLTEENTKLQHDVHNNESDLDSQNALLVSEKAKVFELHEQVSDLKLVIFESNLKIETLQDELEAANDQISDLKHDLSNKITELGTSNEQMAMLQTHIGSQKAKILELEEEVNVLVADVSVKDEEITELNTQISVYSAKEDSFNSDIKMSKKEVSEKCKLIDVLNHKHDAVMSERDGVKCQLDTLRAEMSHRDNLLREMETHLSSLQAEHARVISSFDSEQKLADELKVKVGDLEREVERQREVMWDRDEEKREAIRQLAFSLDHYMSQYKELVGNRRRAVFTS